MNKEHITRGEATQISTSVLIDRHVVAYCSGDRGLIHNDKANAEFIADAFNGFNKTGKTYSELQHINNVFELKIRDLFKELDSLKADLKITLKALRDVRDFDEETSNYDDPGELADETLRMKLKLNNY